MCEKLLLTIPEVGESLGLKRSKVYQILQSGKLRSVRLDGSRRILADDLREFVDQLKADCDEDIA
jgi:excisionase family DNA binding protein